jgi:hypothetical protein
VSRADTSAVENLGGWLTTVVARVCLDALTFTITQGKIAQVDVVGDPASLRELELAVLDDR